MYTLTEKLPIHAALTSAMEKQDKGRVEVGTMDLEGTTHATCPTSRSICLCLESTTLEYFKTENRDPLFETSKFLTHLLYFRETKAQPLLF